MDDCDFSLKDGEQSHSTVLGVFLVAGRGICVSGLTENNAKVYRFNVTYGRSAIFEAFGGYAYSDLVTSSYDYIKYGFVNKGANTVDKFKISETKVGDRLKIGYKTNDNNLYVYIQIERATGFSIFVSGLYDYSTTTDTTDVTWL